MSPRAAPPDLSLVAAEMFVLARAIREQAQGDATARVAPEAVARIAVNVGAVAQAVARADQAYAEGARQRDEAAAHAADITDVPEFLQPVAAEEPEPEDCGAYTSLALDGREWRVEGRTIEPEGRSRKLTLELRSSGEAVAVAALLRTAQQFGRRIRISIEEPAPSNVTKGPGA